MKNAPLFATLFFCLFTSLLFAQAGTLDPNFGDGGKVIHDFEGLDDRVNALTGLVQNDDKIVLGSYANHPPAYEREIALIRMLPDGSLDTEFGVDGKVSTVVGQIGSFFGNMALQDDGKLVVTSHTATTFNNGSAIVLVRYLEDGSLDSTFNETGSQRIDFEFAGTIGVVATTMAIQKDGKILVGGFLQEGIPFDVLLVRCNADGQIDSTFGVDGRVVTDLGERREYINALAITANGSILAAGRSSEDLGRGFLLMKYTPTGELDQSFGNDGVVVTAFDSIAGQANNMALLEDGKIILSGFFRNNSVLETAVIRYLADGTLDPDFGTNGIVRAVPGNGFEGIPFDMKLQKDGKILLVGEHRISENSPGNFALLRLLPNGTPDTDFGINGVVNTSFDDVDDARALAVALQADGSIVAIGITFLSGEGSFAAARYLNELAVNTADISGTSSALLAYPNPVRQSTTLKYTLEKEEIVSINLLDKEGRLLKNFQRGKQQPAGTYHKVLSFPEELAAGTYILQLSTSTGQIGIQLLHVKAE